MDEVTKIHLGRQAFTISVDAHHQLRQYLAAIKEQVEDKDVLDEIELRMAELLAEHGLNANKVILSQDVDYLKEQLGDPNDFKEDGDEPDAPSPKQADGKRLFRDTDNAIIAGVAAGLAEYFGVDVLLIRILFVVATFITVGWGVLLYIVLWLLVPEAKTSSDRLLMAGKPVTVEGLKELVEQADVKGAAKRANATLAKPVNTIFKIFLKTAGLVFILFGLTVLLGLVAAETYIVLHSGSLLQDNIFPVGFQEHLLLDIAMAVVALVALFITIFGMAIFRRRWPVYSWVTGILVGLLLIGLAVGGALAADVYPNVRDRYNANVHDTVRSVQPFTAINLDNANAINVNLQSSSKYYVSLSYYDHPDLASIKTYVKNGTLVIDSSRFTWHRDCRTLCIPDTYNMSITVYAPDASQLQDQDSGVPVKPPAVPAAPNKP